jgi:hypothetical protein
VRRYAVLAVAALAAVGGVAGNLGSILDLYDKFTGGSKADTPAETPPSMDISWAWQAKITYDWGERFVFRLDGNRVRGTASFLGPSRAA